MDLLSDLGGWELANISVTAPWTFADLARDHLASSGALFGFGVSADARNSSKQTIYVSSVADLSLLLHPTSSDR